MKIIKCDGVVDGEQCNTEYCLTKQYIARRVITVFYPVRDGRTIRSPQIRCYNCEKPLAMQIPIEIDWES